MGRLAGAEQQGGNPGRDLHRTLEARARGAARRSAGLGASAWPWRGRDAHAQRGWAHRGPQHRERSGRLRDRGSARAEAELLRVRVTARQSAKAAISTLRTEKSRSPAGKSTARSTTACWRRRRWGRDRQDEPPGKTGRAWPPSQSLTTITDCTFKGPFCEGRDLVDLTFHRGTSRPKPARGGEDHGDQAFRGEQQRGPEAIIR